MIDREEVLRWLEAEGYHGETLQEGAEWVVSVVYPDVGGQHTQLTPTHDGSVLVVGSSVTVSEEHQAGLRALTPEAFRRFRFSVQHDLLTARRVGFQLQMNPATRDFTEFVIGQDLRESELNRATLMNALQDVHDMTLLVVILVNDALGRP